MKKFSSHYIFDGQKLIKNMIISYDDQHYINIEINDTIIEKSAMMFYNGIVIPKFSTKFFSYEELRKFIDILLEMQHNYYYLERNNINNLTEILIDFLMVLEPENNVLRLEDGIKTGFLILENVDLNNFVINEKTILKNVN